jgi:uncharacterized GH25 family protein
MIRRSLVTLATIAVASSAFAHFVYVVPGKDAKSLTVVFSDDLEADEGVPIEKIKDLKLTGRFANGTTKPLGVELGKASLTVTVPEADLLVASGTIVYGISKSSTAKPSLLVYHPKVVVAGVTADKATVGETAALEIVPTTKDGTTTYQLLAKGKPVADAEGSLLKPDGTKAKVKTDAQGRTEAIAGTGRFALWLRKIEAKPGEHAGTNYDEAKHYATLVVDVK